MSISRKKWVGILALPGAVTAFVLMPIEIPYSIEVPGKVLASKEWIVSKGVDGRLTTVLVDHKRGVSREYDVMQFERGDAVSFRLRPHIAAGARIAAMDTIGSIYSNEIDRRLVELEGQLATSRASLQFYRTGEKEATVEEARHRVAGMKRKAEEQKRVLARLEALHDRELVAQEEYEIALAQSVIGDIDVSIAEARLRDVDTGAKDEQIVYIESQIQAFQQEYEILQKRLSNCTLISPISGNVYHVFSGDTLLVVGDNAEYAVVMLVKWRQRRYVATSQSVVLKADDIRDRPIATLVKLDGAAHIVNGGQVLIATAVASENVDELVPGLLVRCSIQCGYVRPGEYLVRFLRSIF